jgi:Putative peptidoglycan binding domain
MAQARAPAVGALIVACIAEGDSTRLRGPTQSTVLMAVCPALINNLAKEALSAEALNAYQTAHHLAVTGKADEPTLAEMKL